MTKPLVLTFSGLDPTGGAGIAADIRAMSRAGAHCLPVVTALTSQTTTNAYHVQPVDAAILRDQVDTLLTDLTPAAIKIGLVADTATAELILQTCQRLGSVPVVADPVLRAGGGTALIPEHMVACWQERLQPACTLTTPNQSEFSILFPDQDLSGLGPGQSVLVTGADAGADPIVHQLLTAHGILRQFSVRRLPHAYHGSGCTLAAAIAARLARGEATENAIEAALKITSKILQEAFRPGTGQWIPG